MNNKPQSLIFFIDLEVFTALLKEAVMKAISEMPTDFIKCEIVTEQNEPQKHGAHPVNTIDVETFGRELIAAINKSSL